MHTGRLIKSPACGSALNISTFRLKSGKRVPANVFSFKYCRPVYIYKYDIQVLVVLTNKLAEAVTPVTYSR
jgi:hypothetical protein